MANAKPDGDAINPSLPRRHKDPSPCPRVSLFGVAVVDRRGVAMGLEILNHGVIARMHGAHHPVPDREKIAVIVPKRRVMQVMEGCADHG